MVEDARQLLQGILICFISVIHKVFQPSNYELGHVLSYIPKVCGTFKQVQSV